MITLTEDGLYAVEIDDNVVVFADADEALDCHNDLLDVLGTNPDAAIAAAFDQVLGAGRYFPGDLAKRILDEGGDLSWWESTWFALGCDSDYIRSILDDPAKLAMFDA